MQTYRILAAAVLCVFLVFLPVKSQAQSTTEPDGWEALVHYYEGQYYTGTLSLGRIPPGGPSYATPSAACTAATNFANQLQPNEPVTGAISGDYEYGIEYPIFSYSEQKYLPTGYFGGYRCQLQREGASPAITAFGWSAHVAVVIIPACPAGTGAAFFDGEVVCGEQFVGKNIGKAGTCEDGDTPLTQPKPCKVGNPIAVDTGEKIEQEQDYATDDGLFSVKRWYRSAQRDSLTTTDTPGFGRNWRGLLPGRLVAKGLVSGSQITNYQIEYQSPEGSFKRFYQNGWAFQAADATRLKLGPVTEPPVTPLEYFKESAPTINMQGDFKLSYANGDYILFSRAGSFNMASLTRAMVPVERGFANGYKIWFDYPDTGQYPNKIRDNLNREMLLSWEDIGWASATLVNVRKGPTPTPPSPDASREKAITSIVLPDQTTVNYSYGVSESSGFKGRLETVLRKNATGAVLWGRGYLYEDMRFPYAITGKSDQNGNRLSTYSYDANGYAVLTERAGGFDKQQLSYGEETVETDPETGDAFGVTEQVVTNSLGRETRYKFVSGASNGEGGSRPLDTPARILAISGSATSNVVADTKRIAYNNGQISGSADANGNGSSQTVDLENRRPTSTVDANGTQTQITWHPTLDIPARTVRKRLQTDYSYDAAGQLTSMSQTDLDNGETRAMQLTVGVAGRTQAINGPRPPDAQGRDDITAMTYDAQGNRLTMSNALGHVTRYEGYDANGRAARVIDANGTVTELVHDDLGRLKTTTVKHPADPAKNAVTAMDYDVEGRVVAITRPDTTRINFDYNLAGLMTAIRSEDGERIDYSYDAMGNRLAETVKRTDGTLVSNIVRTFDEIGRMLTKTLGPTRTHRYEYDKVGNAVRVITARGGVYENSFDSLNRLVQTVTPDESTFSQYYDGDLFPLSGLVTSPGSSSANELGVFEDGNGVKTRFTRNAFGQVKQEISPDRGTIIYEYDAAGDLAAMVDGRGQRVDYTRDILGRVTAKTPQGRPLSERVTYTYDTPAVTGSASIGRLSRIDDGTGATRFAYDHRGNLVTRFQKLVGTPNWVTLRYAYDLADRVDTMTYPSGRQVRYVRNAKGQIVSVRSRVSNADPVWAIVSSNMGYEAFGALKGITFGNGERMVVTRGDDGRLDGRRLYKLSDGSNISHLTYGYDADDNMTRITDKLDANNSLSFVYDPVDRMKRVTAASGAMRRTDYVFDGNGNRIKKLTRSLPTDPPSAAVTENYSMLDASNQLGAITSAAGGRSFAYDARGNMISETRPSGITVNAGYDGQARLISYARTGEAILAHVYNGMDDRVATTTGSDTRRFVYAPDGRVLGEYGSNANDVRAEFIWMNPQVGESGLFGGDDGLGGYMPLAVAFPSSVAPGTTQLSWVHANHMGVPIRYSDASGNTLSAPTGYSVPGFPGQSQTTAELYYNRYRDYDSGTGRYIQADPIGLAGGASPYSYAMNNPLRYSDPTGEFVPFVILGGMAIGAGADLAFQAADNYFNGRDVFDANCYDRNSVMASAALGAVGGGIGGVIKSGAKLGFRAELGRWGSPGVWSNSGTKIPHFHLGTAPGLPSHHLPYQAGNWARNVASLAGNGRLGADAAAFWGLGGSLGAIAVGGAVAIWGD